MINAEDSQHAIKTKQHFEVLDGLRGIAAFGVVVFHFMEWVFTDFSKNFIGHGFLAVDFFFCLSGFVIAYAYDDRIKQQGVITFLKNRFIRLHPLVVLGSVLGLLGFLYDPYLVPGTSYNTGRIIMLFLASAFLIPMPTMEDRAFNLFGLNAPSWSLFWEYVANIVYAFVLYRIGRRSLVLLTIIAGIALCFVSHRAGNLLGGWSKDNFWDGGARVAYSFLMGMAIYRFNWIISNKIGFVGLSILLLLAFLMPWSKWNWITELVVVLIYFPLLIALGAGSGVASGMRKICWFSGNISYPLYMTHYSVIWIFGHYFTAKKPPMDQLVPIIVLGVLLLIGAGYLAMVLFDIPARKYLAKKVLQKTEQPKQ